MAVISNGKTLTSGLIIEDRNLIEFRMKGRRRRRIFAIELLPSPLLLFPIYNVSTKSMNFENHKSLIVETEVGLISKYILKEEKLNLDQITFEITEFSVRNEVYSLVTIRYNNKKLVSITSDTVLTGRFDAES